MGLLEEVEDLVVHKDCRDRWWLWGFEGAEDMEKVDTSGRRRVAQTMAGTSLGHRGAMGGSHCDQGHCPSTVAYSVGAAVARLTDLSSPSDLVAHCRAAVEEDDEDSHARAPSLLFEDLVRTGHALGGQLVVDGHPVDVVGVQVERREAGVVGTEPQEEEEEEVVEG